VGERRKGRFKGSDEDGAQRSNDWEGFSFLLSCSCRPEARQEVKSGEYEKGEEAAITKQKKFAA